MHTKLFIESYNNHFCWNNYIFFEKHHRWKLFLYSSQYPRHLQANKVKDTYYSLHHAQVVWEFMQYIVYEFHFENTLQIDQIDLASLRVIITDCFFLCLWYHKEIIGRIGKENKQIYNAWDCFVT